MTAPTTIEKRWQRERGLALVYLARGPVAAAQTTGPGRVDIVTLSRFTSDGLVRKIVDRRTWRYELTDAGWDAYYALTGRTRPNKPARQ